MQKVVFDTNILVSALINEKGVPAKVMSIFAKGEVDAFYSSVIYLFLLKAISL